MIPDFNKNTIDILAKRAAYKCSNPDCRVSTVGPNAEPDKSTLIGEAAHIFGARPNSKRFNPRMTDSARREWFYRLMNNIRSGPHLEPFKIHDYLKTQSYIEK